MDELLFMQRRMDYSPRVTGSPRIAHYTHDPDTFDGFVFSTGSSPQHDGTITRPEFGPSDEGRGVSTCAHEY